MTRRVFELKEELLVFFREKYSEFEKDLESDEFLLKLACVSDIFEALNNMNLFFKGPTAPFQILFPNWNHFFGSWKSGLTTWGANSLGCSSF